MRNILQHCHLRLRIRNAHIHTNNILCNAATAINMHKHPKHIQHTCYMPCWTQPTHRHTEDVYRYIDLQRNTHPKLNNQIQCNARFVLRAIDRNSTKHRPRRPRPEWVLLAECFCLFMYFIYCRIWTAFSPSLTRRLLIGRRAYATKEARVIT